MPVTRRSVLRFQAAYYVATGALPLISRRAFEWLTGPKREWWLVQMVGLLAVTNGLALAAGTRNTARPSRETVTLSVLSALSFAAIDVTYVLKRRISPVYLVDAVLEAAVAAAVEYACDDDDEQNGRAQRDGGRRLL